MNKPYTASVKVMRSHDYCHFEIQLGSTEPMDLADVDGMRKEAAKLADEAVEQYKEMKAALLRGESARYDRERLRERYDTFKNKPENEWSPTQRAVAKMMNDDGYWQRRANHSYESGVWVDEYEDVEDAYDQDDEVVF